MKTIFNFQFSIFNSRGFTLVELLVVMIILGTVGTIIGSILFSSLRGASKTNVLQAVRQNGNYTISQIGKTIRVARQFNGVSVDGTPSSYSSNCFVPSPAPLTPTPSPIAYKYIKVTSDVSTVYNCDSSNIYVNGSPMLDTNAVSLVSCSFMCTQNSASDTQTININFTLSQAGSGVFAEKSASLTFETSIAIRNSLR